LTNKTPKQTTLVLAALGLWDVSTRRFALKLITNPVSMNSELAEKSYRYKTDENNYKPTKKPNASMSVKFIFCS